MLNLRYVLMIVALSAFVSASEFAYSQTPAVSATAPLPPLESDVRKMEPSKSLFENIVPLANFSILVDVAGRAGVVELLKGPGSYTFFVPSNMGCTALPPDQLRSLLEPKSKDRLKRVLLNHVIVGKLSKDDLVALIKKGKGVAVLKTQAGSKLTLSMLKDEILIQDETARMTKLKITNVLQKNGTAHIVDAVLMVK